MAKVTPTMTAGELADAFKVTTAAVTKWKSEGCPCRIQSGRPIYVLSEVTDWRIARAKESARPLDKDEEQLRKLKEEADRVALENAVTRGELVTIASYEAQLAKDLGLVRAALVSMPSRFSRRIVDAGAVTMARAQKLLAEMANDMLIDLQPGHDRDA